ncbi:MAG: AAA family ATPase [Eisenbergiella sp.]
MASAFEQTKSLTLRQRMREFSRYHGLSKKDAAFFNQSDLLCDTRKEDFIIMGRCGDAIMTNNRIPHISIYITAPFEQRVRHTMEIHNGMGEKKARRLLKHLDRQHSHYYNFYTSRRWGNANNYDLCINSASYGIDGTVEFILRMIDRGVKNKK